MIVLTPTNDAVSLSDRRYRLVDSATGDFVDNGKELTRDEALSLKATLTVEGLSKEEASKAKKPRRRSAKVKN